MGLNDTTATKLSLKRLSGKAMTSDEKGVANEALPSNVVISAQTIFGNIIPPNPVASFYTITDGNAEYLRLSASFIAGSDTSSGRHAFSLHLPDDYEANSSNPKKGTYPFINKQSIPITSGSLQLIPTSFGNSYEALPYHTGSGQTQIPVLDARDWVLDYFSGIFFQQDPPGTGDQSTNPRYVDAYLYVGDFLVASTASSGGGGSGDSAAEYLVLAATGSLSAERVLTMGTGLSSSDGGAGGSYTLSVRDSIFAALTGSQFSGNVGITGSLGVTAGLSGSLTHLSDGSSYLIAGSNVTITTGSSGAVTIAASSDIDGSGAVNRIATWSDSNTLTSDSDFTWDGTTLYASSGGTTLNIQGNTVLNGTVVVNQSGVDKDFRVETQNKVHAFQVDGGTDMVILFSGSNTDAAGYGSSASDPDPKTFTDTNFYVSGSIDSRGTSTRGTAVFGGDVVLSGTLSVNRAQAGVGSFVTITSDGKVGIGSDSPAYKLSVGGNMDVGEYIYHKNDANTFIRFQEDQIHIKAGNRSMIKMKEDASDQVLILSGGGSTSPDQSGFTDTNFFVSGTIGSMGTSNSGTSLFGGDAVVSGTLVVQSGLSGSLTHLVDGSSYLVAGSNVTITTGSSGAVTISSTGAGSGDITGVVAGDGLSGGGLTGTVTLTTAPSSSLCFVTSSHAANSPVTISGANFAKNSFDYEKTQIFVNGVYMMSGSSLDYELTGNANQITFNFDLQNDDIILVKYI